MIKTLTIDRKRWGTGIEGGLLFNPDNKKMCCLGFFCRQAGISQKRIRNLSEPDELIASYTEKVPKEIARGKISQLLSKTKELKNTNTTIALMSINDLDGYSQEARESKIQARFNRIGVKVKFIN